MQESKHADRHELRPIPHTCVGQPKHAGHAFMLAATRSTRQDLVGTQDNNALASQYEGLALGERGLYKIRKEIGEVDEDGNQARARREREAALVSPLENEAL